MKKNIFSVAILSVALSLSSCGGLGTTSQTTSGGGDLLSGALGGLLGGVTGNQTGSGLDAGSLIGGVIGNLLGGQTSSSSIVGTWVYSQPNIQFESENFLAQAGGSVASSAIISKIEPYYQSIGITPGAFAFTFNSDKTCTYTLKGHTYSGTYTFNSKDNTIQIKGTLLTFPSAYVSVSGNSLSLTFDSTKLLSLAQGVASMSQNATVSTISSLTSSFKGMKTGFLFKRQ